MDWRKTQENLNRHGARAGNPDGILGPQTMSALMAVAAGSSITSTISALAAPMVVHLPEAEVTSTPARLAEFLAQTAHETGGYTSFAENMRYSARRLMAVWPRRFPTLASALPFAWDPSDADREDVALANHVYGSRMGNELDGTSDNDGWDHRGGGLIQHTGAEEYEELRQIGIDPIQVHTDHDAMVRAACSYWTRIGANKRCDRLDFVGLRRRINGGENGVEDVRMRRERLLGLVR